MKRNEVFDSLKFVLIFLVVFGHIIEWIWFSRTFSTVYNIIYSFHMPLFIFISGYFSKNITWKKYKDKFIAITATYIIFQTIMSIPDISDGAFDLITFFTKPKYALWYLCGLLLWRFAFCFIPKIYSKPYYVFAFSIIISLISGWLLPTGYLQKYIIFFPYFVLGYYCSTNAIEKIRKVNKTYSIITLSIILCLIILFFYETKFRDTLWGGFSYSVYNNIEFYGFLKRLILYPVSILISACIINICPTSFSKWGDQTLAIYLLHTPLVYSIYYDLGWNRGLFSDYATVNLLTSLILTVATIAFCIYISKYRAIQILIDPYTQIKNYIANSKHNI